MTDKIDVLKLTKEADMMAFPSIEDMSRFTALVMEECAKVADAMDTEGFPGNQLVFQRDCARRLAAAIRERKPK